MSRFCFERFKKTVEFYVEKLGFKYAKHYDKIESFATIYRDSIEFVIQDIDVRLIGVGLIYSNQVYFKDSDIKI